MPFIVVALLLAAAIGGGMSVIAQGSLPGDALWNFKTGINENVGAALAPEGTAQANFDIAAIRSRIKEAGLLSAKNELSAAVKAKIEANFEAHAKSVQAQIEKLQQKGDYGAAAETANLFQAALADNVSGVVDMRATLDIASHLSAETSEQAKQ